MPTLRSRANQASKESETSKKCKVTTKHNTKNNDKETESNDSTEIESDSGTDVDDDNENKIFMSNNLDDDDDDDDDQTSEEDCDNIAEEIEQLADCEELNPLQTFVPQTTFDVSDQYFLAHASKSKVSKASFSTILDNFNLNEVQINDIIQKDHSKFCKELNINPCGDKDLLKFFHLLRADFNILLYGYGSKRNILNQFSEKYLHSKYHYLVIKGYSQDISLKHIIYILNKAINVDEPMVYNETELIELIKDYYEQRELYLVIHSIDMLFCKNVKIRNLIFNLVSNVANIRIVASVDHINAPLLWSLTESSTFRWLWFHLATFEPYSIERKFSTGLSMISSTSKSWKQSINLSSVKHVYDSLNSNAQKIFVILLKHFIESKSENAGFSFTSLYLTCREEFLVNSEITLRAQLSEFKDHNLLKFKKGADGADTIVLCLDKSIAQKFVSSLSNEN